MLKEKLTLGAGGDPEKLLASFAAAHKGDGIDPLLTEGESLPNDSEDCRSCWKEETGATRVTSIY